MDARRAEHHKAWRELSDHIGEIGHRGLRPGAEEVTQDAFVSLWRAAARYDADRGSLRGLLLTIVRNSSTDWLRKSAQTGDHELTHDATDRLEAPERTEEQVIAMHECLEARRLMAGLPPEQREVIDLAYLAGYTQGEIAARLDIPIGTVKGRARLGLHKLRQEASRMAPAHAA